VGFGSFPLFGLVGDGHILRIIYFKISFYLTPICTFCPQIINSGAFFIVILHFLSFGYNGG